MTANPTLKRSSNGKARRAGLSILRPSDLAVFARLAPR